MKYLVKKHCEATVTCTVALGRIQDYYFGTPREYLSRDFPPTVDMIDSLAFNSIEEAEARKVELETSASAEESTGYWKITIDVIPVEG